MNMASIWKEQKQWSDRFLPEIKQILSEHLAKIVRIDIAPFGEDVERNTDLIVLRLDGVRVACRVRKFLYFDSYGGEFTVRNKTASGNKTELDKIREGWGDYLFYGWANQAETKLYGWTLGDLEVLRSYMNECFSKSKYPWAAQRDNWYDGTGFVAFRYEDVPDNYLVDLFGNFKLGSLAKLVLPNFSVSWYHTTLSLKVKDDNYGIGTLDTRFCQKRR
jgi:hypothetical protein